MNILLCTPIYPPEIGGPATYTKELLEKLSAKHHLVTVAYTHNGIEVTGTRLVRIDKHNRLPKRLWLFFRAVLSEARSADVLYAQNAVAAGLPAVIAGWWRRKPVVLKFVGDEAWERATQAGTTHKLLGEFLEQPDYNLKTYGLRFIQGWVLRRCAIVTTPSAYLGQLLIKSYGLRPERVITNYNASESTAPTPFPITKKPHQLVVTARLVKWKGVDGVIKALPLIQKNFPDANLIIHGDGPSRAELEALTAELGLEQAVTFTGEVSRVETWDTRKNSGVYILNSTYEGLPHTALTCFAAGIPIVATDIPGTNEAVYHEKTGLLVPINDPQALAAAVKRLFNDEALQQTLITQGYDLLEEKFSWPSHLKNLEALLQAVSSKPIN